MLVLSRWKLIVVVAALLFGVAYTVPNLLPKSVTDSLPAWVPHQRLNLGLDLQGGSYLLLEVDTNALKAERMTNLVEDIRTNLRDEKIAFSGLGAVGDTVAVSITDPAEVGRAMSVLGKLAQPVTGAGATAEWNVRRTGDNRIIFSMSAGAMTAESIKAVDQSIEIIRRRIDSLGTREPSITKQGSNRIVVQAPGESDPERLKAVIGQTAKLTFQLVDEQVTAEDVAAGRIPPDAELLASEDAYSGSQIVVKRRALVTGEMLQDSRPSFNQQTGQPVVTFRFNAQGARRFGDATTQNVHKRFAIVLDKKVISAPNINEPITGGSGEISGSFTTESANDLALLLRSGALPAPLTVQEQRTVGAELGADAVRAGQISAAIGFVTILVFILLAYGGVFGGIAVIGLAFNSLLLIAAMTLGQATLTLPGIAGMILSLALAVDANVLIYERIRDEARAGHTPLASMEHGFGRALVSILDANVTTLIAAGIMFAFGAGPVRGFAWTLSIGVFTSVFSAVVVGQVLLGFWFRATRPKSLPIL